MKKVLLLISISISIWTGVADSQEANEDKLQEFITKYFSAGSQFYNAKNEMHREMKELSPANKTAAFRLIRKNELELYKSVQGEADKEYIKGVLLDRIFSIAEDISLSEMNLHPTDLTNEADLNALMKNALSQYTGDVTALGTTAGCMYWTYPYARPLVNPGTSIVYFPIGLARVVNEPGEWPCDYELLFGQVRPNVWGTTQTARDLITAFGGNLGGRVNGNYSLLIVGYWRAYMWFPLGTEGHLLNEIVIW